MIKNVKNDDDYAFVLRSETQSNNVYKWITYLEPIKHMILHRVTFDMYDAITLHNVHLDDNSIVKAIGMIFIIMEVMLKCKIDQICITNTFNVPKLHANLFSVSKFVSNGLKMHFNLKKIF